MSYPQRTLSEEAKAVIAKMDGGMRLRVSPGGFDLVYGWPKSKYAPSTIPSPVPVSSDVANEVIASGFLRKIQRETTDCLVGWEEMGLDGENADFYCPAQ